VQPKIGIASRNAALPLSWAQQRLWFLDQLDHAASAAYHIPAALRLRGALDRDALRATLDRIVARHEGLRTTFANGADGPVQVIAPADCGFALAEHELRELDQSEREQALAQLSAAEASTPFDLAAGPLVRGRLIRLADDEHVLLVTQHHVISDGWSAGILVKEVGVLYAAFSQGQPDPLPPLAIQYADYAAWQRQWLQGDALSQQVEFWRTHLEGAPALLELPADRPRPAVQSHAGDHVALAIPADVSAGLRRLSQRHGMTLFMTLLSGWAILLARMSGQNDVVIGTPVANRQRTEIEGLIGFFVNTLALRVQLGDDPSVAQLLDQVKASTVAAYDHQDLPFEQVVEALRPPRSMSYSPLFQVMLSLENLPTGGEPGLPGLTLSPVESGHYTAHFDLSLSLSDRGDAIGGTLVYASDLFERSTIERLAGHFQQVLAAMVADELQRVSALPLLSAPQRRQLLVDFNDTAAPYPHDQLIHQLFEAQAAMQPDAIALVLDDQQLSYGQLNRRANQLAHHLLALGVQPDDRVAICAERSLELIVGLLGILKAGGAYVPLDPGYPTERLAFMLADSAPVALLTQSGLVLSLPALTLPVILLDADSATIGQQADSNPVPQDLSSAHLAYVTYTSGSTGMPKGVMIAHHNVIQLVINEPCVEISPQDRMAYCANPAFDASTWEIWGALLNGAAVVIIPQAVLLEPADFARMLQDRRVTILQLTAGLFREYADRLAPVFGRLQYLLFGGDQSDIRTVRKVFTQSPPAHLVHTYGPTETTTFTTTHEVSDALIGATALPIGRPIANTQVYILDAHLQPVPLGVTGELYIGGAGVARGYLNLPELSAERFLADPFSSAANARMYKTGDLGRWLPDGSIEYLGRNDFQVKIRGFRIELGEIEARLAGCAGVREAVVLAREDGARESAHGDKRLVAYLVAQDGVTLDAAALRTALAGVLAEYMIPSAFVILDSLPLTANGKLDRRALPAPDQSALATREYVAPEGAIEQALAAIWQELLGVERVGRHDHFFELGGHSLLAVQMVSRLRQRLDVELPLRALFAQPTLEGLAAAVDQAGQSTLSAIPPADRSAALPLSWAQQRLWFLDRLDHAASAAYHLPAALRLHGALDHDALRATLDRIVARHEDLRTTFAGTADGPVQVIAPADCGFALAEHDLRALEPSEREQALAQLRAAEATTLFDLAAGPLVRGQLIRLADDEHILLLTQHHVISDGWSMGILIQEVSTLYTAFSQDRPDPLPPLAIQYADYAAWQRQWLQGDVLHRQVEFWRTHLEGAPALLELPTDRPRPAVQSHAGDRVALTIPADLAAGLRSLSQRHGATLFMTLLSGWAILLSRMSGQDDVVIGTPVANRQRSEIETLIGFFINTLALRVQLGDDPSVAQLLAQVKTSTVAAYDHQDLPFEQVVEALRPPRSMSYSPLFQVMLSLDNLPPGGELSLPGLTLAPIQNSHHSIHFDLSLSLSDRGDAIGGTLEYASDLFERSTIERLAGHFQEVLAAMVADERQRVSALPLLSTPQRQQLLVSFNDTAAAYPHDRLIHELFEAQAGMQPDAVAVVFEDQQLTYDQLNRRANQLAHYLLALGVQPDDRVAICAERSLDMIVGLLGILKAGAAYMPLDPGYPEDRLAYMLDDSAPVALLSTAALAAGLPALMLPLVVLDADNTDLDRQADSNPVLQGLTSHHLANVIYTSGSTGMPKGVMVEHRNVLRLVINNPYVRITPDDCVVHCANPAFDASTWEIWGALLNGARLLVIAQPVLLDPIALRDTLEAHRVSILHLTVGLFNQYTEVLAPLLPKLQYLLFGGEQADIKAVERVLVNSRPRHLVHCYGPTETTTFATTHEVSDAVIGATALPIGRPIANTQVYILDAHLQPVPLGVTGELYIGGAGVARGYLNRPELTAERFLRDPFSTDPDARMYKTGDLGRWLPDGSIEYQGRNDFQVKIRGFRIELGEIEARLAACAGVREAVVMAREDGARESAHGDKRLVAYLVPQDGVTLDAGVLRTALAGVLADYMMPSAFVTLDSLPLTANGKLDRRALPAPDQDAHATRAYEAPVGVIETALAAIWQELLGVERVGRHDHFFELGGHSLMVITLIERLRQRDLFAEVRTVFTTPTLHAMASAIQVDKHETAIVPPNLIGPDCTAITPDLLPLVHLTQDEIDGIVRGIPGGAANVQDIYPLAPLQEGILFHHMMESEGDTYLLRHSLFFDGRAQLGAFLLALQTVIDRHDILRTGIHWNGLSQPVQLVQRQAPLPIHTMTLDADGDAIEQLHARTDPRHVRLDLQRAPLLAAYIAPDPHSTQWMMVLLNHHIAADHVTVKFIVEEIQAILQGRGKDLPRPLPYRNFIAQARALSTSEHEAYFHSQLADIDAPTAPFGVLDLQGTGSELDEAHLALPDGLAQRIRDIARGLGVTAAVLFHTAWAQVLAKCTGREDLVFGTVLSGRLQGMSGADRILGLFINTLPVRISLAGSARQVVLDTYQRLTELLVHEQASLALAQRCSAVAAPMPLFTTLLNYRHNEAAAAAPESHAANDAAGGIRVSSSTERTNYPIVLAVDDLGRGFGLTVHCTPGISAERLAVYAKGAIEALVQALEDNPARPLNSLAILPESERQQLANFNGTAAPYPHDQLIHQLFEAQAAVRPDAAAVVYRDQQLTYDQLNRRANQLAHHLLALGVQPDDRVAICTERGLDMIVGLLGILKAGAAYVPLDPSYPADRLAYMLADSAPVALMTQSALVASLPRLSVPLVVLDADGAGLHRQADSNPAVQGLSPRHLAYVIYTSGSTGMPKGVMVEQRSVLNLWHALANTVFARVASGSRVTLNASISFDASLQSIVQLLSGHCVVVVPQEIRLDSASMIAFLHDQQVDVIDCTPTQLEQLSGAGLLSRLRERTRTIMVGGEALSHASWKQLQEAECLDVFNVYGPTECTVDATCASLKQSGAAPVIGRPLANVAVYILDAALQPVPLGVTGELYIGGAGVARGYLNRPELSAERFLADPFSSTADARMYKTGDLGRWLPDGSIEYLGRNDFQVKIRGFRIELGEIEARLAACAGVREAVVLAREDVPGDKRLVAYLVAQDGATLDASALRNALAGVLAEYMMPSAFVTLDSLPLTANGKLDRRALPAPDQSALATREYVAPEGAIEQALAAIWQELLGVERVGRHDHFFELGGHSLLAVQMVSRLRQRLDIELPLRALFAQPTLEGLATAVDQAGQSTLSAIPPADRSAALPLSWAQQRLWFLDRLDHAASAAYHMPAALRLRGALDRNALRATLDRIVARHEGLRTTFASGPDGPVQVIAPADCGFALAEHDLRALASSEREQALAQLRAAETAAAFDLAAGPLIRGQLIRLADDEHILLVTQHHVISDGWSAGILVKEVGALYTAFSQGQADPLPPLAIQYADYAAWQRQWLQGDSLHKQVEFWRTHLEGAPALLELPVDRPRPAVQSHAGDRVALAIPADVSAGLRSLAQRHGATLFMTLLSGWSILLSRLSGQDDVVIGTPVANRQRTEIEALIGFFVNTLALRVRLSDDPSVAQLLDQVKASTVAAYDHQDLPFEQVVEALRPPRSMSYSPLFQVMLSLDNTPAGSELSLPGLTLAPVQSSHHTTHFDLSLSLSDRGDAIGGTLEYASDLFERGTIERLAGHFQQVLAAMVADEQQRVSALPLLSMPQRQQLLVDFNDTAAPYSQDRLIHQLFEAQAHIQPDAIALIYEDRQVTYDQLNRHANQLAHHLLALGVQPDDRVAICAERSLDMIVGLLGILKAGAAYVPLDPGYPEDRLAYMLSDSAPVALLSTAALMASLPALSLPLVALDADSAVIGRQPDNNPDPAQQGLTSRHLAYVIYTSGSTGMPKGVMVEHRNVLRLVINNPYVRITPDDCVVHCANPAFDASTWEIWGALLNGARLLVIAQPVLLDPIALRDTLEAHPVSILHLTVGLFNQYTEVLARLIPKLEYLLFGGEQADIKAVERVLVNSRPRHLVHCYGPTETTTFATTHEVSDAVIGATALPIGRPIANTQVYILDAHLQPVPLGVTGELYIGGAGVARGYLNRPELSAERFLADPFSSTANARMYKTGDLGRWLPDGSIEYQGRNDFQVKIRGFRIELGEIEARLAACAGVREAVVLAREDGARESAHGDKRLVAYLVPQDDVTLDAGVLRTALAGVLADYMMPSAFVTLDSLPLTANGKLDRRALPAPDQDALLTRTYEAPVGATEIALAEIWQELLGVERVGRHDHFFELGGHSLLAVQMVSRLRQRLGVEMPLRELFAEPTLAGYVGTLSKQTGVRQFSHLVTIRATGETMPVFFVHPGGGEVAYVRQLEKWLDAAIPIYGLAATGFLPGQIPLKTIEEMASAYIKEMRLVQSEGPYRIAGYSSGGFVAYEIANQLIAADECVEFVGLLDTSYNANFNPEYIQHDFDPIKTLVQWLPEKVAASSEIVTFQREGRLGDILAYLQQSGLVAPELDEETLVRHLAVQHANRLAQLTYTPLAISTPITVFAAAETTAEFGAADCHGWKEIAGENIHVVPVPGGHLTILKQPHIEDLGQAISEVLKNPPRPAVWQPEQQYQPRMTLNRGSGGVLPVFCVPGAGASVTAFRDLIDTFDANLPVYGLQPRGLDGLLAPYLDVKTAARAFVRSVREICPHGPYRLIGHSFGGWIAFEMALQLLQDGETISSLILLDSEAPNLNAEQKRRESHVEILRMLIDLYELNLGRSLGLRNEDLAPLNREQSITLLFSRLIAEKLLPPRTRKETLFAIFRVFEANVKARYVPSATYEGPLHLASVRDDPENGILDQTVQPEATWNVHASRVMRYEAQGNHLTMLSPPYAENLGNWIMQAFGHG
jgi:amino acid adenylation domain-containing protein